MGFTDIYHHAPAVIILWVLAVICMAMMIIFFFVISTMINRKSNENSVRRYGTVFGVFSILLLFVALFWIFFFIGLMRDARNIWADASSLYVSRKNILLNWYTQFSDPSRGKNYPISAQEPVDQDICYKNFKQADDPLAFTPYRELISAYNKSDIPGAGIEQYYLGTDGKVFTEPDTMHNQFMLSLAYYRYVYCFQKYMTEILEGGDNWTNGTLGFLSKEAANGQQDKRSCLVDPGTTNKGTPDTVACVDPGWDGTQPCKTVTNPCFVALTETVSAQCLLYDDHVYAGQNGGAKLGALAAFGVNGYAVGDPIDFPRP